MPVTLPLPAEKKLTITFRLESGCLGPDGVNHIEPFCQKAQDHFNANDGDYIDWRFIPRLDNALPEKDYSVNNRPINREQASKYLELFERRFERFDDSIDEILGELINQYLGY